MGMTSDRAGNIYVTTHTVIDTFVVAGDSLYNTTGPVYAGRPFNMYVAKFNPDLAGPYQTIVHSPGNFFGQFDTSICGKIDNVVLTAPGGYSNYTWSTGSTATEISVDLPGTYVVSGSSGCSALIDTFQLSIAMSDTTTSHQDTSICFTGGVITLTAPADHASYSWSTGSAAASIAVSATGSYWVLVGLPGCNVLSDTFNVIIHSPPMVSLDNDTVLCPGSVLTLTSVQPAGNTYLWSTGSREPAIYVSYSGVYWLKVTDAYGCFTTDSTIVTSERSSQTGHLVNVTREQTIAYGSSVQLNADGDVFYLWKPDNGSLNNPNINNPVATPQETTVYTVFGYDHYGCIDSASVTIFVDSAMSECIPTAFTPNGDGRNDLFGPGCTTFQQLVDFRIYNRWGQQVFYSNSYSHRWDGTFNGIPQDMGVYYYYIVVARPGNSNLVYKGNVTLIR